MTVVVTVTADPTTVTEFKTGKPTSVPRSGASSSSPSQRAKGVTTVVATETELVTETVRRSKSPSLSWSSSSMLPTTTPRSDDAAECQPTSSRTATSPGAPSSSASAGVLSRIGYYNAEQQKAQGLVFLGNYGGQGSGKWTP